MLQAIIDHLKWRRVFGRTKRAMAYKANFRLNIALAQMGAFTVRGGEERRGESPGEDGVNNFDEKKGFEHIASYMMIAVSMALCIGFALGWLARLVAEALI